MTPPLGPVRLGRSLTLGLVSSFLVGCCFGPEQVFDARVVRLPGANPAGSIGGFLSVAEASFTTGSSTTNVVDTKKNEEDEPADGEDKEIVVPLRSTKSRGSRTKTRTHKTRSRQNGILRHPAAAATIGLTMMLVGTAIGAGAMLALARQREEQKKAEDTRTAQAAKSLEPKKVVLTADKAAQQQAEGDRYLSQVLVSIGGAFLSSSILRIMGAFHVPFIYTGMTDQGLRAMLHQFTAGSPWSVIIRQSLFAMGLSAASNQFGILLTILVPIAVLALLPLFSLLSQTTETKSPENLGQTYIFANNMMKKTLEKERADRPEDVEKVVSKYFDLIRREAIQRKFYDAGARKALDASERSIKSQLKKRGKDIEAVLDSAQAQFLKAIGVNIQGQKI